MNLGETIPDITIYWFIFFAAILCAKTESLLGFMGWLWVFVCYYMLSHPHTYLRIKDKEVEWILYGEGER